VLPRGSGLMGTARLLEGAGVVADARLFALGARLLDAHRSLKAGEYRVPAAASMRQVLALLVEGRSVVRRITFPEGLTSVEMLALLEAAEAMEGEVGEVPAEGTLAPETYHYSWGDSRRGILERMRAAMRRDVEELWAARHPGLPLANPAEAVVLASIVERETAIAEERPRVAAVFLNRLRRGMRLQSDPTVAYALTGGKSALARPLTFTDLEVDDPYNTYVRAGLPPGPIANPGRAALAAVLQPIESRELYFVADGTGGHAFAETYEEHQRNVRRWRQVQRERRAPQPAGR